MKVTNLLERHFLSLFFTLRRPKNEKASLDGGGERRAEEQGQGRSQIVCVCVCVCVRFRLELDLC